MTVYMVVGFRPDIFGDFVLPITTSAISDTVSIYGAFSNEENAKLIERKVNKVYSDHGMNVETEIVQLNLDRETEIYKLFTRK